MQWPYCPPKVHAIMRHSDFFSGCLTFPGARGTQSDVHPPPAQQLVEYPPGSNAAASAAPAGQTFCPSPECQRHVAGGLPTILVRACGRCSHQQVKPAATAAPARLRRGPAGSAMVRLAQTRAATPAAPQTGRVLSVALPGGTGTFPTAHSRSMAPS